MFINNYEQASVFVALLAILVEDSSTQSIGGCIGGIGSVHIGA